MNSLATPCVWLLLYISNGLLSVPSTFELQQACFSTDNWSADAAHSVQQLHGLWSGQSGPGRAETERVAGLLGWRIKCLPWWATVRALRILCRAGAQSDREAATICHGCHANKEERFQSLKRHLQHAQKLRDAQDKADDMMLGAEEIQVNAPATGESWSDLGGGRHLVARHPSRRLGAT